MPSLGSVSDATASCERRRIVVDVKAQVARPPVRSPADATARDAAARLSARLTFHSAGPQSRRPANGTFRLPLKGLTPEPARSVQNLPFMTTICATLRQHRIPRENHGAMDLEQVWYEAFPYLYGIGGVVAIVLPSGSGILKGSGVLLIVASLTILRLRWVYRRELHERTPTTRDTVARFGVGDD